MEEVLFECFQCGAIIGESQLVMTEDMHGFDFGPAEIGWCCPHCGSYDVHEDEIRNGLGAKEEK